MPFLSILSSVLVLFAVPAVHAVTSALQQNLPSAGASFQQALQEEQQQIQEAKEQTGDEFFPLSGTGAKGDASQFANFVTVLWRGVAYELKDVPRQAWFAPFVRDMVNRGIVTGYTEQGGRPIGVFGASDPVTIEQIAKMILAAAGTDPSDCSTTLRNARAIGRWSQQYIACAEQKKLTLFADGKVDVTRSAYRGEVVLTLLEAFGVSKPLGSHSGSLVSLTGSGTSMTASGSLFTDVPSLLPVAVAINRAAKDGVIAGYKDAKGNLTGLFGPANKINRAEVAKILSMAIQVYAKKAAGSSSSSSR